jgi:CHAD domain-containing protein
MTVEQEREVERTYDVTSDLALPQLAGEGGVASTTTVVLALEATYHDTADLALARGGFTLRRRTGGRDDGWHLKLPRSGDARTELHVPLGAEDEAVPGELLARVRAHARERVVAPVVRISTQRTEHALRDDDETVLALVCDDRVRAEQLLEDGDVVEWREWEVELAAGDESFLDEMEARLRAAGAESASSTSKLARALAGRLPAPDRSLSAASLRDGTAADVVRSHLAEHVAALLREDGRVRSGEADSVHKMRIAARRLRAALQTCAPLFEDGAYAALREDLRWLGRELSAARDAQVLRERLRHLVADEPSELVMGPVAVSIDDALGAAERSGRARALEVLGEPRYLRMLDALDALVLDLPMTKDGDAPAREVLPWLLRRDVKRLRRAVRDARRAEDGKARDVALHTARKKAKRLRYAAELAAPALGRPADELASAAKGVQQVLGEHQDTVMSRAFLRELGARMHTDGLNGFSLGRLHAIEEARAEAATRDLEQAWSVVKASGKRRLLRG